MKRRAAGFTLLEVLAAMVLLAFLLLGVYSGIRTATHAAHAGEAGIARFDQIRSAQRFLRSELAQAIARDDRGQPVFFQGDTHEMRFVAPLPGYLGRFGPQLQQWRLVPDGHGGLQLEASFAILPPDGSAPRPLGDTQVLLGGIRSGGFQYRGLDLHGKPGAWQDDWTLATRLPSLVGIDLALADGRAWPALRAPLRINASAGSGPGDLLRGLRGQGVLQ